jgi:ATP-dependent Zn protease
VALHEAGHAVVEHILCDRLPERIVLSAGEGYVEHRRSGLETASTARHQLACLMAGRAAEAVFLGEASNGACTDLERATRLAWQMRYTWALTDRTLIGLPYNPPDPGDPIATSLSQDLARAQDQATKIIETHRELVTRVADLLLERRELAGVDLAAILADKSPIEGSPSPPHSA